MGRWAPGWGALALALGGWSLLGCFALEQGPTCKATQYLEEERCCSKCPPGQKVESSCAGDADTTCVPCEQQHFQAGWTKERHCTPYRYCDPNAGLQLHTSGSPTQDAECHCRNGTHCSSPECQTCRPHRQCGRGEGVEQEASHREDTICSTCPEGFFSDVSSATARCRPWSSCAERNLVQKAQGTRESDVVCDAPPPPPNLPKEPGRTHLLALVLLPLGALVTMGGAFAVRHRRCKGAPKEPQHQGRLDHQGEKAAEEVEEEELCPDFPIQETLRGGKQPPTPEDVQESCLAVQEQDQKGLLPQPGPHGGGGPPLPSARHPEGLSPL